MDWQEALNAMSALQAELAEARAEVERLREALAPFASAEHIVATAEAGRIRCILTYPEGASETFRLADLKAARQALAGKETP
jgi:hypothetical protein